MEQSCFKLSEMQSDLLKELFNLGIGSAARSLSELVNHEIILTVPEIIFETPTELTTRLGRGQSVFSVSQFMEGPFDMHSMLIFKPEDSFDVVKKMLDQHLSDETLTELHSEALTEIGNVVLNSCIGMIGEALEENFTIDLPVFRDVKTEQLLDMETTEKIDIIVSVVVKIEMKGSLVNGHLVFVLNTHSMGDLYQTLNLMLECYEQ